MASPNNDVIVPPTSAAIRQALALSGQSAERTGPGAGPGSGSGPEGASSRSNSSEFSIGLARLRLQRERAQAIGQLNRQQRGLNHLLARTSSDSLSPPSRSSTSSAAQGASPPVSRPQGNRGSGSGGSPNASGPAQRVPNPARASLERGLNDSARSLQAAQLTPRGAPVRRPLVAAREQDQAPPQLMMDRLTPSQVDHIELAISDLERRGRDQPDGDWDRICRCGPSRRNVVEICCIACREFLDACRHPTNGQCLRFSPEQRECCCMTCCVCYTGCMVGVVIAAVSGAFGSAVAASGSNSSNPPP